LAGNAAKVRLLALGTLLKFTHGLCLRAYSPLVQPFGLEGILDGIGVLLGAVASQEPD
jgi:hypothetical protein